MQKKKKKQRMKRTWRKKGLKSTSLSKRRGKWWSKKKKMKREEKVVHLQEHRRGRWCCRIQSKIVCSDSEVTIIMLPRDVKNWNFSFLSNVAHFLLLGLGWVFVLYCSFITFCTTTTPLQILFLSLPLNYQTFGMNVFYELKFVGILDNITKQLQFKSFISHHVDVGFRLFLVCEYVF